MRSDTTAGPQQKVSVGTTNLPLKKFHKYLVLLFAATHPHEKRCRTMHGGNCLGLVLPRITGRYLDTIGQSHTCYPLQAFLCASSIISGS